MEFYDVVGNLGVACIVIAYFLNLSGKLTIRDVSYSVINLIGAVLITYSLMFSFNLSSFVIEMFWIAISLYGIVNWFRNRKSAS